MSVINISYAELHDKRFTLPSSEKLLVGVVHSITKPNGENVFIKRYENTILNRCIFTIQTFVIAFSNFTMFPCNMDMIQHLYYIPYVYGIQFETSSGIFTFSKDNENIYDITSMENEYIIMMWINCDISMWEYDLLNVQIAERNHEIDLVRMLTYIRDAPKVYTFDIEEHMKQNYSMNITQLITQYCM